MATAPRSSKQIDRRQILQGVYEDNLRTVFNQPRQRRLRAVKVAGRRSNTLVFLSVGLIVLAGFAYRTLQGNADARSVRPAPTVQVSEEISEAPEVHTVLRVPEDRPDAAASELRIASLYGLKVKTIVIDPGHGGIDGGTVGRLGTKEKDITLDVARRLKVLLERNYGYRILLTRDSDVKVSLRGRTEFANAHDADLFVSIHVNWIPAAEKRVIETYYFSPEADQEGLQLARRENEDSGYSVAEFNAMLRSVGSAMKAQESERLAQSVQQSLYRNVHHLNAEVDDWGVKRAPFVVLLGSRAPSILAEIACLNNEAEENKLNSNEYREKLAIFLEQGIIDYLQQDPDANESTDGDTRYAATEKRK
ncbi:MAG TPA: N-acetylmuramoyl-L-alanine amidase [Rhodothermales bacterium]|nr:N-acetylmuramoyl-L-alanine amidase [Rhodothermales bacterium]